MVRILLTGDTGEAAELAACLPGAGVEVSRRRDWPEASTETALRWIGETGADALVSADHPFAAREARAAGRAAEARRLPHLRLLRPAWTAAPGDDWHHVGSVEDAAAALATGATVFLATGRSGAAALAAHDGCVHCRHRGTRAPPYPEANGEWAFGAGPFDVEGEVALFRKLGIDCLVTRNVGGAGAWPKVEAARRLSLPVVMIERPEASGPMADTVQAALDWARAL